MGERDKDGRRDSVRGRGLHQNSFDAATDFNVAALNRITQRNAMYTVPDWSVGSFFGASMEIRIL